MKVILALLVAVSLTACGKQQKAEVPLWGEPPAKTTAWRHGQNVDKMSGEVTKWSMLDSTNKVDMKFPYSGGSEATIVVFGDSDVKIYISKGQVMCRSWESCAIKVKFDNEKPMVVSARGESNGNSNSAWLMPGEFQSDNNLISRTTFLRKLKTAKKVMISLEMYQEGYPVWEFKINS